MRKCMALSQKKLYTIKDIYSLPNGQRAELIDRQIYIIWLFLTVSIKNYEKIMSNRIFQSSVTDIT